MTTDSFIRLLEAKQLLPDETLAELRLWLDASPHTPSAKTVAVLLVEQGLLTEYQAGQLLEEATPPIAGGRANYAWFWPPNAGQTKKPAGPPPWQKRPVMPLKERRDDFPPPPAPKTGPATPREPPANDTRVTSYESFDKPDLPAAAGGEGPAAAEARLVPLDDQPLPVEPALGEDVLTGEVTLGHRIEPPPAWYRYWARLSRFFGGRPPSTPGQTNEWDSPLLLVGGGTLILLVLVGGVFFYLLSRQTGDQQLQLANEDYRNGSYTQAIHKYERFLDRHPNNPNSSVARVRQGLARLRQSMQTGSDFAVPLETALEVLPQIEDEEEFSEARAELASLLPDIAEGLAEQARTSADTAVKEKYARLSDEALGLVANGSYVPRSLRPGERVAGIEQVLVLVRHDLKRDSQLSATLDRIQAAVAAGRTSDAYTLHRQILKEYPELRGHPSLDTAVDRITAAEKPGVQAVEESITALTEPRPTAWVASVALADRRGPAAGSETGDTTLVVHDGVVYGLDAATGKFLWQRQAGQDYDAGSLPNPLVYEENAWIVDVVHGELVCLEASTGKLKWRHAVGERFAAPVLLGDRLLVATRGGKMLSVDGVSGRSDRHIVFPQGLATPPSLEPRQRQVYQVGEHSSLYVLSAESMECSEVFYLGHLPGTVQVAPVTVLQYILVAENWGARVSTLHVLATDDQGLGLQRVDQIRLEGHVVTPPVVEGRRVVLATDRGELKVYEVTAQRDKEPLVEIAQRGPTGGQPWIRYALVADRYLWIADNQLAKFEVHVQRGKLVPQALDETFQGDAFDYPLQRVNDLIVHARRHDGRHGLTAAAFELSSGQQRWEVQLGMRPAAAPLIDPNQQEMAVVTSSGALFSFPADIKSSNIRDAPRHATPAPPRVPALDDRADLPGEQAVFAFSGGARDVLFYNRRDVEMPLRWLSLADELTCSPVGFGNGVLLPTYLGQVLWRDPRTEKDLVEPFQPRLEPGVRLAWSRPCVVEENGREFVVSDGRARVYRVGVQAEPKPHLAAMAETPAMAEPIVSPLAAAGRTVYGVNSAHRLESLKLPELTFGKDWELNGQPIWGPETVGDYVMLATDQDQLWCLDAEENLVWQSPLPHGPLAGPPLEFGDRLLLASSSGVVWQIDVRTGHAAGEVHVGWPLATGPTRLGEQIVVVSANGTVLVIEPPGPVAAGTR